MDSPMCPSTQALYRPFKLNVAALGNIVSQLHVHVTARLQVRRQAGWQGWQAGRAGRLAA